MTPEAAETLALRALGWLAGEEALSGVFLGASGLAQDEMRARAGDPEFLAFVLDFLLTDDAALIAFSQSAGVPPDAPMRARAALPGGDLPNWT